MLLFLAALAEIILGLYHLAVPCLLLTAFYFSCLLPWQKATLPVLLAAACSIAAWDGLFRLAASPPS